MLKERIKGHIKTLNSISQTMEKSKENYIAPVQQDSLNCQLEINEIKIEQGMKFLGLIK